MAHPAEHAGHAGHAAGGILQKETAGMPNWVWLSIIAAGIAAAYIVPKFLGGGNQTSSQKTPDQASSDSGTPNSGLGLAVDPTTGLPYAVEGLVPSGGLAGGISGLNGGGAIAPGLIAGPGLSASPSALPATAQTDTPVTGATATQATADMTATNDLLQGLLNQLQQGPVPVNVENTAPIPMLETNASGGNKNKKVPATPVAHPSVKTTKQVKVPTSAHVPTAPVPRPTTPTQPATRTPTPVAAAHKKPPVLAIVPPKPAPRPVTVPKPAPRPVVSIRRPVARKG